MCGGGGFWGRIEFLTAYSYGLSHCAFGTRSRFDFYVLSLSLNKERTKENQPRRSLLELPGIAALQSKRRDLMKGSQGVLQM
jgi:hypothetical protein